MYGPTETTIWSTLSRIDDAHGTDHDRSSDRQYHASTFSNARACRRRSASPANCASAAKAWRVAIDNRPDLTAEKFVHITLPNGRVERVYRTGDMARFRADGRIEFLGRRDQQVKVRGYRIELGEIEAVLASHPGVKECVVAVREDSPGDQRMVGYVVTGRWRDLRSRSARTTLRARLPEYMVPNLFSVLAGPAAHAERKDRSQGAAGARGAGARLAGQCRMP